MKKRPLKKGFTLVELVVVIAVIAVLAAVSVGAYFGITETANLQAAKTHVKQLNDMLLLSEIGQYKKNDTCHQARNDMRLQGLDIIDLKEFGSYRYAWDSEQDRIVLIDISKKGELNEGYVIYPQEIEVENTSKSRYFLFVKSEEEIKKDNMWSYYLHDDFIFDDDEKVLDVEAGIDTGYIRPSQINIVSDLENKIILNTNFFETQVTIDSSNSVISHYGYSKNILLDNFAADCYVENGIVGRLIVGSEARNKFITLNQMSEVFYLNADIDRTKEYGILYTKTNTEINSCGDSHDSHRLMCDFTYVYEFCEGCGLAVDSNGKNNEQKDVGILVAEENPSYNNGKKHTIIDTIKDPHTNKLISKCSCSFMYYPHEGCDHSWVICEDIHDEELNVCRNYKCALCDEHSDKPKANVKVIEELNIETLWADSIIGDKIPGWVSLQGEIGTNITLGTRFTFEAIDSKDDENKRSAAYDTYKDYYVDFVVSFTHKKFDDYEGGNESGSEFVSVAEINSFGLWGAYDNMSFGFHNGVAIPPGVKIPLIGLVGFGFTYEAIVTQVVEFECGAFNCSPENEGLIMTVELCMRKEQPSFDTDFNLTKADEVIGFWVYEFTSEFNDHHGQNK